MALKRDGSLSQNGPGHCNLHGGFIPCRQCKLVAEKADHWSVEYHEGAEVGRTYDVVKKPERSPRVDNETQRMLDIREALTKTGMWRGWRNNTGQVGRLRFGLGRGGADLVGILIGNGRFCAFEIKDDKGRSSPDQKLWGDAVRAAGGFYAVVRTVREAIAALKRAMVGDTG